MDDAVRPTSEQTMGGATRATTPRAPADIERDVVVALRTCYDPEIPVDIYELGLIYDVAVAPSGVVAIRMTLTAPNCPAAQDLPAQVEERVRAVSGVTDARVDVVFDPPWCSDRMSEAARLQLGML
jgi:FeS assembly SUF system protein